MTTHERVCAILARQFGVPRDKLRSTTTIESLGADSYDLVELQMSILEEFALEIPEHLTPVDVTFGDIVRMIEAAHEVAA